jgi:secreted trypsin-like serine protease
MTRLPLLALAAFALTLAFAVPAGAKVTPRIVLGGNADITEFPFQVALFEPAVGTPDQSQFCGGVIVNATHVITAAHCLFDFSRANQVAHPDDIEVFAGSANLADLSPTLAPVATTSFDPRYDPSTNDYDVGVITLKNDLTMPQANIDSIQYINDPDLTAALAADPATPAFVTGWGDTTEGGFPTSLLQKATVPLVPDATCATDYAGDATITPRMFCAGGGDPTSPGSVPDSCQGDSGGPIVVGTPGNYKLAGLVDSGEGCGHAAFPGIYTRVSSPDLQSFLGLFSFTQAPIQNSPGTTMTGGNAPGQTLTCDPGAWDGATTTAYQFVNSAGQALTPLSAGGNTYTIQASDLGTSIVCQVKVSNDGGYGFGRSRAVFVPAPVAPAPPLTPPSPAGDTDAPSLRVAHKSCTKTSCTVKIKVRDASPSSGIAKVRATLNFARKVRCKSRKAGAAKKKRTCTTRAHRTLRAGAGKGGVFTITVKHLTPGTGYTITLLPIDKAGNRPQFSTITSIRTKPRHRSLLS